MFIEIILQTPMSAASRMAAGSGSRRRTRLEGADEALVTERVGKGVTWCPFTSAAWFQGVDQRSQLSEGTDPIVLGESVKP